MKQIGPSKEQLLTTAVALSTDAKLTPIERQSIQLLLKVATESAKWFSDNERALRKLGAWKP
jgi:hypothetical protein